MLSVLANSILPVFAILALGMAMGRFGKTSSDEARVLNRFAFLVLQPVLIFSLLSGIQLSAIEFPALAIYIASQWTLFAIGFAVARLVLKRGRRESVLLAMATMFVNTLLYMWPISVLIYGSDATAPVTAIVAWDSSVSFAAFICAMEVMTPEGTLSQAARRILRNPILIAIVVGLGVNAAGFAVPLPLANFAHFAGAAAAPLTLFALGVILVGSPITPDATTATFVALKLFALPALVMAGLALSARSGPWADLLLLSAAGPSGAMAFALALLYGVRSDAIARVIVWTSFLSLLPMAFLA